MSYPPASRSTARKQRKAPPKPKRPNAKKALKPTRDKVSHSGQKSTRKRFSLLSAQHREVVLAGGAIALLATAIVLPTQVSSQAIPDSSCETVVKSGAEISRGQLLQLLEIPTGTAASTVQQVVNEPYCTLPVSQAISQAKTPAESGQAELDNAIATERAAYPLAFDPEAWVVLSYEADEYLGYDFVFKP
ncbi:MAG: hypothetical protein AAFR58_17010 [Cyanobacteria bacterium J06627_28]